MIIHSCGEITSSCVNSIRQCAGEEINLRLLGLDELVEVCHRAGGGRTSGVYGIGFAAGFPEW